MPSLPRRSTKVRQTRLAFTPLPSSSPTAATYSSPVRDRLAGVRYENPSTPSKRRRVESSPQAEPNDAEELNSAALMGTPSTKQTDRDRTSTMLPTPVKSSQVDLIGSLRVSSSGSDTASDTEHDHRIITNPFKRRSLVKDDWENTEDPSTPNLTSKAPNCGRPSNQSKLDPSGLPAGVSSHQQFFLNGKARAIVSSPINLDSQSAESGDDDIVSSTARRARVKKSAIAISNDTESKDSGLKSPLRSGKKLHIIQDSQSRPYISHPPIPRPHSPDRVAKYGLDSGSHLHKSVTSIKTQKNMSQRRLRGFDASVSGQSPKKHQTRSMARTAPNPSQDLPELVFSDKDEEDSDIVLVSPARKRRSEVENSKKGRIIEDDVDEESEDEIRPSPVKRRGRVARPEPEDGGDLDHQPQREFDAVKSSSQQEQEDLEEDLEDLQQSSVRKNRIRVRVGSSKQTEKQRQLELLRRRRAGEKIVDRSLNSDQDTLPKRGLYDSETQDDTQLPPDEDEEGADLDDWGTEAVRESLRADDYDEDFVVEDDHTLGAPSALEGMPLEFTRHAYKKPIEHFKDAVEWMVQKKLNPAFTRDDPVYQTAFMKLNDEVKGYSSSRFMSAVWGSEFSRALRARPEFYELAVPTMFDHKCDACNRSGHPAKYKITFSGKPYHHSTLEDISDDEEDDEDEDEAQSHDSRGNVLPSVDKEYFVGRFCKANAETAHALSHWRYHLNQWVLDWLQNEGYTSPQKILEREKWSIKRKRNYANEIVDTMEEKGEIKALYRDFKHNLEAAREAKPSRYAER